MANRREGVATINVMPMERTLPPCCMLRGCGQYNRRGVANRREGVNVNGEDSTRGGRTGLTFGAKGH